MGRRRRDVQRPRRLPQDARRHDVPVVHGDAGKKRIRRAAARTCCGWRWPAGWTNRDLATTTCTTCSILCLECRACKAECPVGVDVARFKSEFLADYWKRHGTPLRARVIGHIHDAVEMGQPVRAALERGRAQRDRPMDQRTAARHR